MESARPKDRRPLSQRRARVRPDLASSVCAAERSRRLAFSVCSRGLPLCRTLPITVASIGQRGYILVGMAIGGSRGGTG